MNRWKYEKKYGFYYQDDIIYYNNLIEVTKATLSIYYPKNLLSCRDEYKFYKCKSISENDKMAMFLLDYNEKLPKHIIKNYTDSNIIIIKPNFHNPYKAYDIILSISEIKASIKYISANFQKQLYVIGYGIFGEICNILGVSMNNGKFDKILKKLETEDNDENIYGIISIMPVGGFDIGDSGFEWLIGDRREFVEKNCDRFYENAINFHNNLIDNYKRYLNDIFNESIFNDNLTIQYGNKSILCKYYECFQIMYNFINETDEKMNDSFPIYDEITDEIRLTKIGNRIFGNYIKEKPQHFDEYLSNLVRENIRDIIYTDFSNKNNFGKNLNITERVNLSLPLLYLDGENKLPDKWYILSNKNFLKNRQFPNEFNLYLKLNNLIQLNTTYKIPFKDFTIHQFTLNIFNNKTNYL